MAEEAIFLNSGPLFSGERLESLEDTPEWQDDEAAHRAHDSIRKAFEKHATLLAGGPTLDETRFHMIAPTLHALGFAHSVFERVDIGGGQNMRVDYVLFPNGAAFKEAQPSRGTPGFFRTATGIAKAVKWNATLDVAPETEEGEASITPGAEIDVLLRTTGREYGILTNGCDWRLYHRGTSVHLNTFFQADMIGAIKSDFEDFKRFYLLFRKEAFSFDDSGTSFLDRMLQ